VAIEGWRTTDWAEAKKGLVEQRTIIFVDESGFGLLPALVRIYAPRGQTPHLRAPLRWEHLSVMAAVTPTGKLYTWIQARSVKGRDIVRFLRHLMQQIPGKLLIVWDGLPAHRSRAVKDFLTQGAAERIRLQALPAYAPEMNPAEGIWNYLKRVELKNCCCHDLSHLRLEVRRVIARLRHKAAVLTGCIRHPSIYTSLSVPR
jgi:transposase